MILTMPITSVLIHLVAFFCDDTLRRLQVKLHRCHSRLSGIFLKNQKDCGPILDEARTSPAMTESKNDVVLLYELISNYRKEKGGGHAKI
jgi:hypothetical protein